MSIAGLNLKQPAAIDWSNFHTGSKYQVPPPAKTDKGQYVTYQAKLGPTVGQDATLDADDDGNLVVKAGPVTLAGGYVVTFYDVSTRQFTNKKTGEPINANSLGKLFKACGVQGKPQTNNEYIQFAKACANKNLSVCIDWRAKNKDTGEEIKGYENFPDDPKRPGEKMAVIPAGTQLPDGRVTTSEVLFANAVIKFVNLPK